MSLVHTYSLPTYLPTYANKKKLEQSKPISSEPTLTTQYNITNHDSPTARYLSGLYPPDQSHRKDHDQGIVHLFVAVYRLCVSYRPGKEPQIKESKDRTATEQDCIGAKISPRFSLDPRPLSLHDIIPTSVQFFACSCVLISACTSLLELLPLLFESSVLTIDHVLC